ncbi:hypothetical protein LBYZC6_43860 [Lacrimispora brassicae]
MPLWGTYEFLSERIVSNERTLQDINQVATALLMRYTAVENRHNQEIGTF